MSRHAVVAGAGLGFRRALLGPLEASGAGPVDFYELAPENWIGVGGRLGARLRAFTERHPFVCHGLSLSLGGPAPLGGRSRHSACRRRQRPAQHARDSP